MPHLDYAADCPDDNAADTLGGRLSLARDLRGLGLGVLARRARVPARSLSAWESDRAAPEISEISRLALALGVSPMWLSSGIGDGPPDEPGDHVPIDPGFTWRRRLRQEGKRGEGEPPKAG